MIMAAKIGCLILISASFCIHSLLHDGNGLTWEKVRGSLAEQIRWADSHPAEVRALGIRAQQRIREQYTWDRIAEEHDRFFRQVAAGRGLPA